MAAYSRVDEVFKARVQVSVPRRNPPHPIRNQDWRAKSYARVETYWGHGPESDSAPKTRKPRYSAASERKWAVEDSNLQPWD